MSECETFQIELKLPLTTVVSYKNENVSLKWELPTLLPLSLKKEEYWREDGYKLAALIFMKNSQFYRTLRYLSPSDTQTQLSWCAFRYRYSFFDRNCSSLYYNLKKTLNHTSSVFFDDFSTTTSKYLPKFWVRWRFWLS